MSALASAEVNSSALKGEVNGHLAYIAVYRNHYNSVNRKLAVLHKESRWNRIKDTISSIVGMYDIVSLEDYIVHKYGHEESLFENQHIVLIQLKHLCNRADTVTISGEVASMLFSLKKHKSEWDALGIGQ